MNPHPSPPPLPRGACPTLETPMAVADGLLARFRPVEGLSPRQARALGAAAEAQGNGLIEVTARGNLQVRGLTPESAAGFRADLAAAGIAAQPAPAIEISPLAGIDPKERADPRPLAHALRAVCDTALKDAALSPKLSIVLITGGQVLLDGLKADIRLVAHQDRWGLELGGTMLGALQEDAVPAAVAAILGLLQKQGARARATDLAPPEVAYILSGLEPLAHADIRPPNAMPGPLSLKSGSPALRIGLPFGQVRGRHLAELADIMEAYGIAEARPAPDRTLILLGFSAGALRDLAPALAARGWWTRPEAAGAGLSICSGAERGPDGIIQSAELAQALCAAAPGLIDGSFHIHVSTCDKGCPHAGRPGVVLDGQRLRLYRDATRKPFATLDPGAMEASIRSLALRIRDHRHPGESTLSVLGRLGE